MYWGLVKWLKIQNPDLQADVRCSCADARLESGLFGAKVKRAGSLREPRTDFQFAAPLTLLCTLTPSDFVVIHGRQEQGWSVTVLTGEGQCLKKKGFTVSPKTWGSRGHRRPL